MTAPEVIAESLRATLSTDANTRMSAELKLAQDLTQPGKLCPHMARQ